MLKTTPPIISNISVTPASGPGGTLFSAAVTASGRPPLRISYQWHLNGAEINGATGSSYVATSSGQLTVLVAATNQHGSDIRESAPVAVTPSLAAPVVTRVAVAPASGGVGDTFAAVADAVGVPVPRLSYRWLLDGAAVPGETGHTYTPTDGGTLAVEVTASNSEGIDGRQSDVVMVGSSPIAAGIVNAFITPEIGALGDRFSAIVEATGNPAPGLAFQWHLNGTAIPGANGPSYVAAASGHLSAVVTADNGISEPARAETPKISVAATSAAVLLVSENGGALRSADQGGRILIKKAG